LDKLVSVIETKVDFTSFDESIKDLAKNTYQEQINALSSRTSAKADQLASEAATIKQELIQRLNLLERDMDASYRHTRELGLAVETLRA
jgi:hypothetical protein